MSGDSKPEIELLPPLPDGALRGKVALITGGAGGFGRSVAKALVAQDVTVVLADVDERAGEAAAAELGVGFTPLDVADLDSNRRAVRHVLREHGALHLVHLNAGVIAPFTLGNDFDVADYRRVMAINLDGVVFGFHAARPALLASGGGSVVATSSLAGLDEMPVQPAYGAGKHAVIGLVRALGAAHAEEGIRVNAICPGMADTPIIDSIRTDLAEAGVPIIPAGTVADATVALLAADVTGRAAVVQAGVPPYYYTFRRIPAPR